MREYPGSQVRNVILAGHSHSGKTSLIEALLFNTSTVDKPGTISDGNTVSDYDPEEVRRASSINLSIVPIEYRQHKINILDAPGSPDFIGDIRNAARVADAMVIVIDSTSGVDFGTLMAWELAEEFRLPRMFVLNKINHEKAKFESVLEQLKQSFGCGLVLMNLPYGVGSGFRGSVNLLKMQLASGDNGRVEYSDIPTDIASQAHELRAALIEAAAEGDDELTAKFLEGQVLGPAEVLRGLKEDLLEHRLCPVSVASATEGTGCMTLLDFIVECFPAPGEEGPFTATDAKTGKQMALKYDEALPASAWIFKTISDPFAGHLSYFKVLNGTIANDTTLLNTSRGIEERIAHLQVARGKKLEPVSKVAAGDIGVLTRLNNTHTGDTLCDSRAPLKINPTEMPRQVVHMAIKALRKEDEDKVALAMHRLMEQDPTLHLHRDTETHETILSGMGDTHLDVAVNRLKTQNKVDVELHNPKIAYRETLTRTAKGQGRHKKQSGGHGQFGDCWIRLEPLPEGSGFEFGWEVVGGVVPTKYQPSIEKGIIQAMQRGVLTGHPVVDVRAVCYDGSHHSVDSSDMAFQIAASKAFAIVAREAGPAVLEPICRTVISVPEADVGDVMGDLNSRRGKILGIDVKGRNQVIDAMVPQSELAGYSRQLRSLTQGRGTFQATTDHYERVPTAIQETLIAGVGELNDSEV